MTTNHPAHGPVSLDRLHQIREILSKAAAQIDGGNLGYAMADAVKAIDELLSVRKMAAKEAVYQVLDDGSWTDYSKQQLEGLLESKPSTLFRVVYPSPSLTQPAVADEVLKRIEHEANHVTAWHHIDEHSCKVNRRDLLTLVNACRAAMLQDGNSPATPDGWIPVSERMPNDKDFVWCYGYVSGWTESDGFEAYYDATRNKWWTVDDETVRKITHWMPLPAAPQQEVK